MHFVPVYFKSHVFTTDISLLLEKNKIQRPFYWLINEINLVTN